jgi:hypothetical protein
MAAPVLEIMDTSGTLSRARWWCSNNQISGKAAVLQPV